MKNPIYCVITIKQTQYMGLMELLAGFEPAT